MRKLVSVLTVILCVFLGLWALTAVSGLMNLTSLSPAEMTDLMQGKVEQWFSSSGMWLKYPAVVPFSEGWVLFERNAVALTVPFILGVYYFLRVRNHFSFLRVGLVCLMVGLIPVLLGRLMLLGNTMPEKSGPWVATMLLGAWYATLACLLFTLLGMVRRDEAKKKKPEKCRILEEHQAPEHIIDWA